MTLSSSPNSLRFQTHTLCILRCAKFYLIVKLYLGVMFVLLYSLKARIESLDSEYNIQIYESHSLICMSSLRRLICFARGNKKTPVTMATLAQVIIRLEHRLPIVFSRAQPVKVGRQAKKGKKVNSKAPPKSCRIRLSPPPRKKYPNL